jgi:hypothetical protein
MSALDELIGWLRLTVGSVVLPNRGTLRILSGATAADNPTDDCTDLTIAGAIEQIGVSAGGEVPEFVYHDAPETLEFSGFTATETTDTLTITPITTAEYLHGSGDLTYYHDAELCELTIPSDPGCYMIHACYTMADHTTPTQCAYYEAIFCCRRAADGTLSAASTGGLGGVPEGDPRYGNFGLVNIAPYTVVGTDTLTFKANAGGLVPATVYDVSCDVRIMSYPEPAA